MRLGFFLFFVAIPFFAALGFDYLDYKLAPSEGFQFNQIGFLWAQNFRESYLSFKDSMPANEWAAIAEFLKQPAVLVSFIFAHLVYVLVAIIKVLGWFMRWNRAVRDEENQKYKMQDTRDLEFLSKNKSEKYKYKYKK